MECFERVQKGINQVVFKTLFFFLLISNPPTENEYQFSCCWNTYVNCDFSFYILEKRVVHTLDFKEKFSVVICSCRNESIHVKAYHLLSIHMPTWSNSNWFVYCLQDINKTYSHRLFRLFSDIIHISISCLSFRKDLDFSREILSSDLFGLVRVEMNQFMSKHISSYQFTCLLHLTVIGLSTVFETSIKPFRIDDLDI